MRTRMEVHPRSNLLIRRIIIPISTTIKLREAIIGKLKLTIDSFID